MSVDDQRLLQALETYSGRAKGKAPEAVAEAIKGLTEALSAPVPSRDTPGNREALKVTPGATGEHFSKAATGEDKPTPGQMAARGISDEISKAAEQILASAKQ